MNRSRHDFQFGVDGEVLKLVTVQQAGRGLDVTVCFSHDVALSTATTHIDDVIDPQLRTDEHGLTIEWKSPLVRGFDWFTAAKQQRF